MPGRSILRALLAATAAIAALALAARAWIGPYEFGLSVHSPMNAESIFGASLVLLLVTAKRLADERVPEQSTGMQHAAAVMLLIALMSAIAWPTLSVGFLADDYSHLLGVSKANVALLLHWFTVPASDNLFFRPVAMVSYWIDFAWAGFSPVRWHAAELALHAMNAALVFALGRKLALDLDWALFGAAFFAMHGSRPEAVTWVAARFDLLATLFVLVALLLFLAYRERPRAGLLVLMLVAAFCGLFSKESAFVLPLLMAAFAWFYRDRSRATVLAIAEVAALTLAAFLYRWFVLGGIGGYVDQAGRTTISTFNAPLALKALGLRLWAVLLVPINWTDALDPALKVALTLALVTLVAIGIYSRCDRVALLGVGFTLIAAVPVYHLLLIGPDLEKSRVIYLGSAGFALFAAAVLRNAPRGVAIAAMAAILSFQAAALRHNLATWDRVSRIHLAACNYLGVEARRLNSEVVAVGMPNTWDGVYMLKTGLPECVEVRFGVPAAGVHMVPAMMDAGPYTNLPIYVWDAATARIVPAP